ncbi:hypothetical protein [Arthrobacter sp. A2-55]|uniref:hypothetical protein n=1 Tax=Arthrobacter sp. A2-55 TaxID=2897337 RepID=UPI0021CDB094|nr:hypothetical protein [Arthrobacter sp. A2-55]MCU6480616.1 hypothetical protein [Arthrobacter sp. A2-55]
MKNLEPGAITHAVQRFMGTEDGLFTTDRARSWDFCYEYFRNSQNVAADQQTSCLQLGYYLASWGMLRGSTYLFKNTNARHYIKALEIITNRTDQMQAISPATYGETDTQKFLVETYRLLGDALLPEGGRRITLVTKTMMGVWGVVPSFDKFFMNTFSKVAATPQERIALQKFNEGTVDLLGKFYDAHKNEVHEVASAYTTLDFASGQSTGNNIPTAKVLDIFGFSNAYYT